MTYKTVQYIYLNTRGEEDEGFHTGEVVSRCNQSCITSNTWTSFASMKVDRLVCESVCLCACACVCAAAVYQSHTVNSLQEWNWG